MAFSTIISRPLQLATRALQWCSAVIVMGLTSYFISKGPHGQHIIYQEVIVRYRFPGFPTHIQSWKEYEANLEIQAVLSVVFFLPAFISPFFPSALSRFVLVIDVIFSYLYASPPPNPIQSSPNHNDNQKLTQNSWLTAFIFAAQDYNWHLCYFHSPPGISCGRKHANEAFIFLALYVHPRSHEKNRRIPDITITLEH
jgi:hypothetical protein